MQAGQAGEGPSALMEHEIIVVDGAGVGGCQGRGRLWAVAELVAGLNTFAREQAEGLGKGPHGESRGRFFPSEA